MKPIRPAWRAGCALALALAYTGGARARDAAPSTLADYLARALEATPAAKAAYQDWLRARHSVSAARRLPEPTVSYAVFLRQVETRVGPQRQRVSYRQMFPWPTVRRAQTASARHRAAAAKRRLDAVLLSVRADVARAYWRVWRLMREQSVHQDHVQILKTLSGSARARVETGKASLANLAQIDLRAARLEDMLAGLDEALFAARAELRRAVGLAHDRPARVASAAPALRRVAETSAALRAKLTRHPELRALQARVRAARAQARAARDARFPQLGIGADWIDTGPARMPTPDSGKDAAALSLTLRVPLWTRSYREEARAAAAAARAEEHRTEDAHLRLQAQLDTQLSRVRDSHRKAELYEHTLIPQGKTVLKSVLGSYQTGRANVVEALLAQQDLVELQLGLIDAQASHATAWAELEAIVGQAVEAQDGKEKKGGRHE